jgi:hypothetical protein
MSDHPARPVIHSIAASLVGACTLLDDVETLDEVLQTALAAVYMAFYEAAPDDRSNWS